jgi:hypothetical protein
VGLTSFAASTWPKWKLHHDHFLGFDPDILLEFANKSDN